MASKIVVNLDTSKENYIVAKCKQNDDLTLEANIFENGEELDITNKEITIQALKADNTYIIQNTDITKLDKKFEADLVRDFSRVPGTTKIEVVLVEEGKQNTTMTFYLEVEGSVIRGAVESKDSITALEKVQEAVTEIGRINEETKELIENSGAASKEEMNKVNASLADIETQKATKQELDVERSRINVLTKVENENTEGNTELLDIRIGVDGKEYGSAGENVREPIRQLCDVSPNLFNIETAELGKYMASGDTLVDNEKYNTTARINVRIGDVLYFSNNGEPVQVRKLEKWSVAGNYQNGLHLENISTYTVEDNIGTIAVSYSSSFEKFQIEKDKVSQYKPYGYLLKSSRVDKDIARKEYIDSELSNIKENIKEIDVTIDSTNMFDISTVNYNKYASGGVLVDNSNYNTTDKIPVTVGETIFFSNDGKEAQVRTINCWSIAGNYLTGSDVHQLKTYTVPENTGSIMISYDKNYIKFQVEKDKITSYKEYGKKYVNSEMIDLGDTVKEIENNFKDTPIIYMPNEICVAVGRTIEIYNKQICINADKFHFRWYCNVGKPMERKFQVTGTSGTIGTYDLTLTLFDDNMKQVYQGTTKLKITNVLATNKTNLQIGDSLTNTTSTYKPTFKEMKALSSNKLTFIGTRGTIEGEKHEGRSGWTSGDYLKATDYSYEKEGINPFWDGTRFNWNYYKTQTSLNPDSITIFLGTNGLADNPTSNANNIKQMVDYIRQDDTDIPIFIVNTIYKSNQNGIGTMMNGADGFATNRGMMKYDEDMKTIKLALKLQELFKSYSNLHLIPLNLLHDDEYNFGQKVVNVNPRSSITETIPTDAIHPESGYLQFADVQFSSYCCHLN